MLQSIQMDIGAQFEDDFFEEPKEKKLQKPSDYEAKVCLPLWYMDSEPGAEDDALINTKHQADFYYYSENYPKAIEAYERCLQLVPESNTTSKREFMENLCRSLLHLGSTQKALEWGLKLYACSCNSDQKVVSMNLLATVCHKLGKYKEELEALHYCIDAHKCYPDFWMRLGHCYAGLFNINLPGCVMHKSQADSEQESCCAFNLKVPSVCQSVSSQEKEIPLSLSEGTSTQYAVASTSSCTSTEARLDSEIVSEGDTVKCEICTLGIQIVSTCFIQTRVLMDTGGRNLLGIERDLRMKDKITACLRYMEVDQSFIDEASKLLGSDFLAGLQDARGSSTLLDKANSSREKVEESDA